MRWCISLACFSILFNSSLIGFFQSSKGLRQGYPLSLFLFILAMEAFSCILKRDSQGGFLEGFLASRKGGEGMAVSYPLFANDT